MDRGGGGRGGGRRAPDRPGGKRRFRVDHSVGQTISGGHSRGARLILREGMAARVVTFGEIMMRLAPPGHERFLQTSQFLATFGGGEANVAVALSALGHLAAFVT